MIVSAQRIRSRVDDSEDVANSVQKSLESLCYERGVLFLRGQLPTYFPSATSLRSAATKKRPSPFAS